jgi:hypothetical protein
MRTPSVSSNHHALASIGRQNVFGHTMACLSGPDTYCDPSHLYCNCELTARARAMVLAAMTSAKRTGARGTHNQATG